MPAPHELDPTGQRTPSPHRQSVARDGLIARLTQARQPVVAIVAPAGYGKSTLLFQLAERESRASYLRLDATHDDTATMLVDLVNALDPLLSISPSARKAILAPATVGRLTGTARLLDAVAETPALTLLLDDLHHVRARPAQDALAWMVDRMPSQHRLVLASRSHDLPGIARARSSGSVLDVGAADLAFRTAETQSVAALEGSELGREEAAGMVAQTDGWPVAIYLALRARVTGQDANLPPSPSPEGHRALVDYMRSELLDPLDDETRTWLTSCAPLDELSGPLCDAALQTSGSLRRLREFERTNQLVVPVDASRTAYRVHTLFRNVLRDELDMREPDAAAGIAARGAAWLESQGDVIGAVRLAHASEDIELTAQLVSRYGLQTHQRGRLATVDGWLDWFEHDHLLERYPAVAVVGAGVHALYGRTHRALAWLEAAERSTYTGPMPDGTPSKAPWISLIRGLMMPAGLDTFLSDEALAREGLPAASPWQSVMSVLIVIRAAIVGSATGIEVVASEHAEMLRARGAAPGLCVVLGEWAALELDRGEVASASRIVADGLDTIAGANLQDYVNGILIEAVAARVAVAQGRTDDARRHLATVNRIRPQIMTAFPWMAVQARIHAARACLALHEPAAARILASEVDEIRRARPDLGALDAQADALRETVRETRAQSGGLWALTNAEIRLLAFLPTHLTFREIAERMQLSPNTVKTQTMSIYGKLEVSSRRAALEQAVMSGLLDPSVLRVTEGDQAIA